MAASYAVATEITLTDEQVDQVLADNPVSCPPVEECPEPPVEPPEPPVEPPVPEQCQDSDLQGTIKQWTQVFYGAFPLPTYQNVTYQNVPQDGYYSIQFYTGNIVDDGKMTVLENAATPYIKIASFSKCKGYFGGPEQCSEVAGGGGGLTWSTKGTSGACELQPYTTYYWNISFVDPQTGLSKCKAAPCYVNFQYYNL